MLWSNDRTWKRRLLKNAISLLFSWIKKICLSKYQNTPDLTIRPNRGMLLRLRTFNWKLPSLPNQDDSLPNAAVQLLCTTTVPRWRDFTTQIEWANRRLFPLRGKIHTTAGKWHPSITEPVRPKGCKSIKFSAIIIIIIIIIGSNSSLTLMV